MVLFTLGVFGQRVMHYMSVLHQIRNALLNPAWVCFTWVGMTVGISMIATPIRFTAMSITRPVALDVGRVVFAALNKAEIVVQRIDPDRWNLPR